GSASATVQVDKTAPTVSAAATTQPNSANWYNANVAIRFTCLDTLSGVPSGACPADQVLSTEGNAVSSTAQTVMDRAGNVSQTSNVVAVRIDRTPPVVAVAGVTNGTAYGLGNAPAPTCTTTDALSGVATPASLK